MQSKDEAERDNLLGSLLRSNINEKKHSESWMTTEDVIEECKVFYFVGKETTTSLLKWTMVTLTMHQNWQELAREEICQIIGKNQPIFDDLNHLKTVNTYYFASFDVVCSSKITEKFMGHSNTSHIARFRIHVLLWSKIGYICWPLFLPIC